MLLLICFFILYLYLFHNIVGNKDHVDEFAGHHKIVATVHISNQLHRPINLVLYLCLYLYLYMWINKTKKSDQIIFTDPMINFYSSYFVDFNSSNTCMTMRAGHHQWLKEIPQNFALIL